MVSNVDIRSTVNYGVIFYNELSDGVVNLAKFLALCFKVEDLSLWWSLDSLLAYVTNLKSLHISESQLKIPLLQNENTLFR